MEKLSAANQGRLVPLQRMDMMSELGKSIRMQRIFGGTSCPILTVAVDHMITYPEYMPEGLRRIQDTIGAFVEAQPHAITMNKGVAVRVMKSFAGKIPLIIQQMAISFQGTGFAVHASVEEVLALGADSIAVAILVKGPQELDYLQHLGNVVAEAEGFGLPVIAHIYPMKKSDSGYIVSCDPEDVFFAARSGFEMGVDMVKIPYTGNPKSFGQIVALTPLPVLAAGGPRCNDWGDVLTMMRGVGCSGAAGATVGRNAWGREEIVRAVQEMKAALVQGRAQGESHGEG